MTKFKKDKKRARSIEITILNLCIKIGENKKKAKAIIYELKKPSKPSKLRSIK